MQGKFARFRTLKGLEENKEKKEDPEPIKPKIKRGQQIKEKKKVELTPEQYQKLKQEGLAEFNKEIVVLAQKSLEKLQKRILEQ